MTQDSAAAFKRIYGATRTDSYASEAVPRRTGSNRSHLTDQRVARSATPGLMAVDQKSGGKSSSRCELCLADVANKDHDGYADSGPSCTPLTHESLTIRTPGQPTEYRPLHDGKIDE